VSLETDYNIFRAIRGARDEVCGAKRWGMVVAFLPGREKRKGKMIFFLKKCEKNYFIVNKM